MLPFYVWLLFTCIYVIEKKSIDFDRTSEMGEILKKYKMLCTQTFTSVFKLPFRSCYGNLTEIPDSFSVLKSGVIIDLDLKRMLAE